METPFKLSDSQSKTLDLAFDDESAEGFEAIENSFPIYKTDNQKNQNILKRVGNGIGESKILPVSFYTDNFTATQVTLLLEMIRYCMEKSAEGKSDENKEFVMNVHIKNRSNSDFIFSIGDEPMPPIPYEKDVYIGH